MEAAAAVLSKSGESGAFGEFVGDSPALKTVQRMLVDAATSDMRVLMTGGTGTGKGLAAKALHRSRQHSGPFIQVNCGAITQSLVDSELFGHEKGLLRGR